MSSAPNAPPLAERTDIHKSCKSLETLLNILNDYCEAAGAVVTLQKKLAKALRDAAGVKVTGTIPGNALNSSAAIFEVLSEIDSKFAKFADKEYDNISSEVKKWFKKLAKEEKAHDDWIANSNARIKQAGMLYEKKSKRSTRDAEDEHARYINLLSTLGPEISQEKYNHTLQVTQRHTLTTYNVAACLSRIADAEWLRVCEGIRRISPTVGPLGEWRSYCEGGWNGATSLELPDVAPPQSDNPAPTNDEPAQSYSNPSPDVARIEKSRSPNSEPSPVLLSSNERGRDQPPLNHETTRSEATGTMRSNYASTTSSVPPSSFEPPRPLTDPNTGSVRSLSDFPAPPTHFPIPPRRPSLTRPPVDMPRAPATQVLEDPPHTPSLTPSNVSFPTMPRLTESPLPDESLQDGGTLNDGAPTAGDSRRSTGSVPREQQPVQHPPTPAPLPADVSEPSPKQPHKQYAGDNKFSEPTPSATLNRRPPSPRLSRDDDRVQERKQETTYTPAPDTSRARALDRTDTGTSSIVATMKNRISSGSGRSTSPPPKDIPRLPLSVANLASRYQPTDSPSSSITASPSISRRISSPPLDTVAQARLAESAFSSPPTPNVRALSNSPGDNARNTQRMSESTQMALAEKERQLQMRERELEMKAKELERDRARLLAEPASNYSRNGQGEPSSPGRGYRERNKSFETRPDEASGARPRYSYSTTHLVPPSGPYSTSSSHSQRSSGTSSQPPSPQHLQGPSDHAPYCGCDKCSVAKYKMSPKNPSPTDLRPPERPILLRPEKPKGWMRRLSMPVGNPFSLDHKRNNSATVGNFSLDGKKNASSTALRGIQEDGRMGLRYDAGGGISNRSVTSFTLGQR